MCYGESESKLMPSRTESTWHDLLLLHSSIRYSHHNHTPCYCNSLQMVLLHTLRTGNEKSHNCFLHTLLAETVTVFRSWDCLCSQTLISTKIRNQAHHEKKLFMSRTDCWDPMSEEQGSHLTQISSNEKIRRRRYASLSHSSAISHVFVYVFFSSVLNHLSTFTTWQYFRSIAM